MGSLDGMVSTLQGVQTDDCDKKEYCVQHFDPIDDSKKTIEHKEGITKVTEEIAALTSSSERATATATTQTATTSSWTTSPCTTTTSETSTSTLTSVMTICPKYTTIKHIESSFLPEATRASPLNSFLPYCQKDIIIKYIDSRFLLEATRALQMRLHCSRSCVSLTHIIAMSLRPMCRPCLRCYQNNID